MYRCDLDSSLIANAMCSQLGRYDKTGDKFPVTGKSMNHTRLGVRLRVRLGVATTYNPPQSLMYRPFEAGWGISIAFFAD